MSKSTIAMIRCDNCGETVDDELSSDREIGSWYAVSSAAMFHPLSAPRQETKHFCSPGCITAWAEDGGSLAADLGGSGAGR